MLRRWNLTGLLVSAAALSAVGCGGDEPPANTGQPAPVQCPPGQYYDGQYCQTQAPAGQPAAQPGAQPAAQPGAQPAAQPGVIPGLALPPIATQSTGPQATPIDPTMAQAATMILNQLATQYIPAGAKPVGGAIAGQFSPGQSLESQVQMQPGKCYTVVGAGVPPVADLNIQLVPVSPIPGIAAPVVAQDQTVGPNAVVGEKAGCYKWALPIGGPMKIVLTVAQGQGIAAAQVYEK